MTQGLRALHDDDKKEFWATLALRHCHGMGSRTVMRLLKYFGTAYEVVKNIHAWTEAGVSEQKRAQFSCESWRTTAQKEWDDAQRTSMSILLWHHKEYPPLLRALIDAPSLLYCRGQKELLLGPCLAVVGSRTCTSDGVHVASLVTRDLSKAGVTIVSGMAQGIDHVAHVAALGSIGKSIAVLGTGVDVVYPQGNGDIYRHLVKEGLVVSEFAPGTSPMAGNFPVRNRIISGLSLGVLVVEGSLRSGSLITARQALEQNRDVFAIPGSAASPTSRGCQELIRQGAKPVFNAEDILHELSETLKAFSVAKQKSIRIAARHTAQENVQTVFEETTHTCAQSNHVTKTASYPPVGCVYLKTPSLARNSESQRKKKSVQQRALAIDEEASGHVLPHCKDLSAEEHESIRQVLKALYAHGEADSDTLCLVLEKPIQQVNALLLEMELCGLVKKLPGGRYAAQSTKN